MCALLAWGLSAGSAHAQLGGAPEDESEILVQEGERQVARRQFAAAARSFERALELNPRRGETYRRLAELYYRAGNPERAVAMIRTASELEPSKRSLLAELGAYLLEAKRTAEGLAQLRAVLAEHAELPAGAPFDRALVALARHHLRNGDARAALVATRRLVARGAEPERVLELARLYARLGMSRRALELLGGISPTAESKLAQASALASIDCARAAPLLGSIDPAVRPEVLLLRGRCALVAGELSRALEDARAYLARAKESPRLPVSDGYGLLGDAYAAAGDFAEARSKYHTACLQGREPCLWAVRQAGLYTREGRPERALETLGKLGGAAPSEEWWLEMGHATLAVGQSAALTDLRQRLSAVVVPAVDEPSDGELFGGSPGKTADPRLWTLLGELSSALGEHAAAEAALRQALQHGDTPRARRAWLHALIAQSAELLAAGQAERAEQILRRAPAPPPRNGAPGAKPTAAPSIDDELAAALARNLGVALLARGQAQEAAQRFALAVDYSSRSEAPTALLLLSRAQARSDQRDAALASLEIAAAMAQGAMRKEVAIERAALEIDRAPEVALRYLREVVGVEGDVELTSRFESALHQAQHAAALARLRAGDASGAFALLDALAKPGADLALRCNHALAAVAARQRSAAAVLQSLGDATCSFGGTPEGLAILNATLDGQIPGNGNRAIAQLDAVARRAPEARALVAAATRVVALAAADHAYRRPGQLAVASQYLRRAAAARSDLGQDELAHNLMVLRLAQYAGKSSPDQAEALEQVIAELSRLEGRVPEATVNLGVAYDLAGRPQAALEAWQRARARFAAIVGEWIRVRRAWLEAP